MIKRIFKEILAGWGELCFGIILVIILTLGLSLFQVKGNIDLTCGMDTFAFASNYMAVSVFILSSFISVSINKNNFNVSTVVLSKKNTSVWNYTILKTVVMSVIIASVVFMVTFAVSKLCFDDFINYDKKESFFYLLTGQQLTGLNYKFLLFLYFCQSFFGTCIAAIAPMLTFWYFKSYFIGVLAVAVINVGGNFSGADYIFEQNIFYDKMLNGTDIRYHIIFPAITLIILMIAGSLKTKRDYI